jgi:hypothetical protein
MIKIKVTVDFDDEAIYEKIEAQCHAAMEDVMVAAWDYWRDLAEELNTTRKVYREAVQKKLISPGEAHLFLQSDDERDHFLANALELGYTKYNIWPAVLSGRGKTKSKSAYFYSEHKGVKKAGQFKGAAPKTPFVDIPFRPGATIPPGRKMASRPAFFRRMSRGNIQGKWIHPGFDARDFASKVVEHVEETAPDVFGPLLRRIKV